MVTKKVLNPDRGEYMAALSVKKCMLLSFNASDALKKLKYFGLWGFGPLG